MDITSAYTLPSLKQLVRTFTYDRTPKGYITVKDAFAFDSEGKFETALITRNSWKKIGENTLMITGKKEKLKVTITASKGTFSISDEVIDEGPKPYTRIAIKLNDAAVNGFVTLKFEKL